MVSIIIPVYNVENRIRACIESVLNQSYPDIELILIDDGSKDASFLICQEFEKLDSRVHAYTQENQGVSFTRNRGIQLAKGKYIQFVDSDDLIESTMTETLLSFLEQTDTDLAVCGIVKKGEGICDEIIPKKSGRVNLSELNTVYPNIFSNYVLYSPVNKMYKKEFIQTGFEKGLSFGEDFLFNLNYVQNIQSIVFIQQSLYHYLIASDSLIKQYKNSRIPVAKKLYIRGLEFCDEVHLSKQARQDLSSNFMETFIYDILDFYTFSDEENDKKKAMLYAYCQDECVQKALNIADIRRKKHKMIANLIRYKMYFILHVLLIVQAKYRNK